MKGPSQQRCGCKRGSRLPPATPSKRVLWLQYATRMPQAQRQQVVADEGSNAL